MDSSAGAEEAVEAACQIACAENRVTKPINDRKVTKASDLKIGQLVFVKDHCKGPFDPRYTFDHRISAIVNESMVVLTTPMAKRRGATSTISSQCQQWSHQEVLSNSFRDRIQKDPISTQPWSPVQSAGARNK